MSQAVLLDTNVILRFLLADHETLSPRARAYFRRAAKGEWSLLIPSVVVAECVFTLRSFYKLARADVAAALLQLLRLPGVEAVEGEVVRSALSLYAEKNVDFADAYLAALAQEKGLSVGSFDRDLGKLGVALLE
ncbi:PIN domain-containing protein [Deinococcus wulumuqiensis]